MEEYAIKYSIVKSVDGTAIKELSDKISSLHSYYDLFTKGDLVYSDELNELHPIGIVLGFTNENEAYVITQVDFEFAIKIVSSQSLKQAEPILVGKYDINDLETIPKIAEKELAEQDVEEEVRRIQDEINS